MILPVRGTTDAESQHILLRVNLNTKCSIPFSGKFSPLSKTRSPFFIILPVRGK